VVAADFVRHERTGADVASEAVAVNPDVTRNTASAAGRTILLAIDYVSLQSESRHVLQTAKAWLSTLGPADRVGLVALPQPGIDVGLTTDHARIAEALDRIASHPEPPAPYSSQYNISPWETVRMWDDDAFVWQEVLKRECVGNSPNCPREIEELVRSRELDVASSILPVIRSLQDVIRRMRPIPGPKHVLLLSSGWLMSDRDATRAIEPVALDAALSNAIIHTFTTERSAATAERSKRPLDPLASAMLQMATVEIVSGMTGGRAVRLPGKATLAFESLSAGLAGYYRLGVRAAASDLDGKRHAISTKLLRRGLTLTNTRRVFAATRSPAVPAAGGDARAALRAALESPTPELGLDVRAGTYVLHADAGMRDTRVVVVGDVARGSVGPATAVAALFDLDGRPATAMETVVDVAAAGSGPLTIELTVPAALYVLRVAVRDAAGKVGSLERPVDARWKHVGPVVTPGLVLFRSALGASTPSGLVLETVTRGEALVAQLSLAASTDRATPIVFEVTRPDDPAPVARRVARIAETTAGVIVARDALPAATLPPGRYTLTAKIGDGAATLSRQLRVIEATGGDTAAGAR
jgi:hypothetical protein